jgi:hypothetical protein
VQGECASWQILPDQVVVPGHRALLVFYTDPDPDPGVVLAREVCRLLATTYPGPPL